MGVAFSVRIHTTPGYREGLVAAHRPLSLNPFVGGEDPAVHDVGRLLYRGLLRLDDRAYPVADLAGSYSVSPDGFTYSLTLAPSLRWSDGTPLTVADVAATVSFVQTPGLVNPPFALPWKGVRTSIAPPDTVRFTLPAPRASFAAWLADFPILPLGRLDPPGVFALPGHPAAPLATSGPYRVLSTDTVLLRLESNRYSPTPPRLDRLELHLFPDFDGAARSMAAGQVDAVLGGTPRQQARLSAIAHTQLHRLLTFRFVDLAFNERTAGLEDAAVRHAIAGAIDRGRLVGTAVMGAGEPQSRAIPAAVRWIPGGRAPPPDPEAAAAVLQAAGWVSGPDRVRARNGVRLAYALTVADSGSLPDVAREVARQLRPTGVALTVQVVPAASFVPAVIDPRAFSLVLADWDNGSDPDVSSFWRSNAIPPQGFNVSGGPPDPFLDQSLDALATATDQRARVEAASRVDSQLADAVPAVFLYAPAEGLALSDSVADAAIPDVGGGGARFQSIASWGRGPIPTQTRDLPTIVLTAAGIIVALAAVIFTAARVAGRLVTPEGGSGLERLAVGLFLGVVQVVAVLQMLGALHLLWPVAVLVTHVLIAAAVVSRVQPGERSPEAPPPLARGWLGVLAASLPFASVALAQGLAGPSGELETRRHHIANAAHWLVAHETWSLPFSAPGDATAAVTPGNTDLIALWTMLPTHTDELSYVVNLVFAMITVLSAALIVGELGTSPWRGGLAAVLVITAPLCFLTQTRSILPDLAVTAGLLFAVATTLRGRHAPRSPAWPVLAGLGLGLAAGSQFPALVPALVVMVWAVMATPRHRLRTAGLLAAGLASITSFWYLRNWLTTGSPIFPVPLAVAGHTIFAGGPDAPGDRSSTALASHLLRLDLTALSHWMLAVWLLYGLGLIVLVALVFPLGAAALVRRRPRVAMVVGLAPLLALAYLVTPGTGGGPEGDLPLVAGSLRLSLAAVLVAVLLSATVLGTRAWLIASAAVLPYNLALDLMAPTRSDLTLTPELAFGAILLALVLLGIALGAVPAARWWSRAPRWQSIVGACAGTAVAGAGAGLLLRLGEGQSSTTLTGALAQAGRRDGLVVVVHDADLRSVLGGHLDVSIGSAGTGRQGQQALITDGPTLTSRIEQMNPAAVVVGTDGDDPPPPGWRPPPSWRLVGTMENGARVYLP